MPNEVLISEVIHNWQIGSIIRFCDENKEPCDYEITRIDETGTYGVKKEYKMADND